jgi:hypothetical protein
MTKIVEVPIRTPLKADKDGNIYFDRSTPWVDFFRRIAQAPETVEIVDTDQSYQLFGEQLLAGPLGDLHSFIQSTIRNELEEVRYSSDQIADLSKRLSDIEVERSFVPAIDKDTIVRLVAPADYGWSGTAPTSHPKFDHVGEMIMSANTNAGDAYQYIWWTDGTTVYGFRATWSLAY